MSVMQHRRRKATAEELAQGERDMKEAQKRMEREAEALGELPLEDGVVDEKGNGKAGKGKKSKKAVLRPRLQLPCLHQVKATLRFRCLRTLRLRWTRDHQMHLGLKDRRDRLDLRPRERRNS